MALPVDHARRPPHPIRLIVTDDLRRRRLTVAFRLILALPHLVWLTLFGMAAFTLAFVVWLAVLIEGRAPRTLHDFLASYTRYAVHLSAYLSLAADPYPGFTGAGPYPVDVEIDPPGRQRRVAAAFRVVLVIPAFVLSSSLAGSAAAGAALGGAALGGAGGLAAVVGMLGWFSSLARGRMSRGMRDAAAYAIRYGAQTTGYALLITERYPDSAPGVEIGPLPLPMHPVSLDIRDDLRRPRLLVLFRLPLVVPHLLWLVLWFVPALAAALIGWVCALVLGRLPAPFHRFLAAYVRARLQVFAFLYLVGRQFPGFVGDGSYPIDLTIESPERQRRLGILFRLVLAVPALLLSSAYGGAALVVAVLGWFAALATGRMPAGLRDLGAVALRYEAQLAAYALLLTPRYPDSSPALGARRMEPDPSPLVPAPPGGST